MSGRNIAALCLQHGLQQSVMDDFKMLLGTSDVKLTPDNIERLTNACLVVNALGPKVTAGHRINVPHLLKVVAS